MLHEAANGPQAPQYDTGKEDDEHQDERLGGTGRCLVGEYLQGQPVTGRVEDGLVAYPRFATLDLRAAGEWFAG